MEFKQNLDSLLRKWTHITTFQNGIRGNHFRTDEVLNFMYMYPSTFVSRPSIVSFISIYTRIPISKPTKLQIDPNQQFIIIIIDILTEMIM